MILWNRNLPDKNIDFTEWKPFIKNDFFRENYMKFTYLLMALLFLGTCILGRDSYNKEIYMTFNKFIYNKGLLWFISIGFEIFLIVSIFIVHEFLHVITVYKLDDISLTHSGMFFWLNTNAVLTKIRFWLFMTTPIIVLSIIPFALSIVLQGYLKGLLLFIGWSNLIIASADLINSILIFIKPNQAIFCGGYYKIVKKD